MTAPANTIVEPTEKRVIAFVDGQNLFNHVKSAFGYDYPNYDVQLLALAICKQKTNWNLKNVKFFTGIPVQNKDSRRFGFWTNKLAAMGRRGITVYSRKLVYRQKTITVPGFGDHSFEDIQEKGIDVRLSLEVLHAAQKNEFDVGLIFSQDQDLSEIVPLIDLLVASQKRWIKIASAYPTSLSASSQQGIANTIQCPFDQTLYDACIDPRDYRPKP